MIQDAEERLKKDTRTAKRSAAAAKLPLTKEQMKVKEQLEADRLERASKAPAPASRLISCVVQTAYGIMGP